MKTITNIITTNVPTFLWGHPGIGKTARIEAEAKNLGLPLVTIVASTVDPTEMLGLRYVDEGRVKEAPPSWFDIIKERGIIFFDELSCASPSQQAAVLRIFSERKVGSFTLGEEVFLVAAGNPPEEAANGYELALPMANRFKHIHLQVDSEDFVNNFPSYWGSPKRIFTSQGYLPEESWAEARSFVAGFLSARRELIFNLPKTDSSELAERYCYPTPRSWDFVSRELGLALWKQTTLEEALPAFIQCVGRGPAYEIYNWLREMNLPKPEDILSGDNSFLKRTDIAFACLSNLSIYAINKRKNGDKETLAKTWKVVTNLIGGDHLDLAAVLARNLLQAKSKEGWKDPTPIEIAKLTKLLT